MESSESGKDLAGSTADRPFAITSLKLENFRGFESLEVHDWSGLNILVGSNGSGKTAILDAICSILHEYVVELLGDERRTQIDRSDIRLGHKRATIAAAITTPEQQYADEIVGYTSWSGVRDQIAPRFFPPRFATLAGSIREAMIRDERAGLAIICYYGFRSLFSRVSPGPNSFVDPRAVETYSTSFDARRDFGDFFDWFKDREDLENERRARGENYEDGALQAVRMTVGQFLDGFSNLRIERSLMQMVIDKGPIRLEVKQLSDGERALLALVSDITRQLAISNPASKEPQKGSGIVLIDEIDLHLHPSWQRRVVKRLPEVFPNVQFFLTTHSPIVASSAPQGSLYLLTDGRIEKRPSFGQDVDLILEEVFDTPRRDEAIQREINALFEIIETRDGPSAKAQISKLEHSLGNSDPMLVRARIRMVGLGLE